MYRLIWIAGQHCFHMSSHNSQIFTFFADFPVVMFCSNCLGIEPGIPKKDTHQLYPHHRPWDGWGGPVWGVGESSNPGSNVTQVLSSELSTELYFANIIIYLRIFKIQSCVTIVGILILNSLLCILQYLNQWHSIVIVKTGHFFCTFFGGCHTFYETVNCNLTLLPLCPAPMKFTA